jgi:hypothetical protein
MEGFRFHDLRHTGQTLAASTGVKDLMKRLGHASAAAANRYLHAVEGRDAEIAAALSELATSGDAAKLPASGWSSVVSPAAVSWDAGGEVGEASGACLAHL